jgi:transposase
MSGSPAYIDTARWVNTREAASYFGRHIRTIRRWLKDGTLRDFGFLTMREPGGQIRILIDSKRFSVLLSGGDKGDTKQP